MADKKPESGDDEQPVKKRGKLLIIIGAVVLLLVLAGGGAAYFLLKKSSHGSDEEGADEAVAEERSTKKSKKENDQPPVFVKLDPFTVKLQPEGNDAYLQAIPELRVLDIAIGEKVKQYMPEIRHKVLLLLSGKKPSELSTPQGVQTLSNEMRDQINEIIGDTKRKKSAEAAASDRANPNDPVQAVLFTSFIIQ